MKTRYVRAIRNSITMAKNDAEDISGSVLSINRKFNRLWKGEAYVRTFAQYDFTDSTCGRVRVEAKEGSSTSITTFNMGYYDQ